MTLSSAAGRIPPSLDREWNPVNEEIIGDEAALRRLVRPLRSTWRLQRGMLKPRDFLPR
jgi:hypothetical protein